MISKWALTIIFISVSLLTGCNKHFHYDSEFDEKGELIGKLLNETFQSGNINGNVLVKLDDKTVFAQSFGFTDGSRKTYLNAGYRFNLGSIYKEFPAVAIMQLQEENRLKVDDSVATYFSDLPAWSQQVTIKHLLQYSSGLPKIIWGLHPNINDQDVWSDLKSLEALAFKPGTGYLYSNNNPLVLQKIVEKITGQSFYSYAIRNLFEPSGMSHTILSKQFPYHDRHLMAIPFNQDYQEDSFALRLSLLYASTAEDLFKWNKSLQNNSLITKQSLLFLAETADVDQKNMNSPLGQVKFVNGEMISHQHHGTSGNFESIITHLYDEHVTVILMTNHKQKNLHELTDKINQIMRD